LSELKLPSRMVKVLNLNHNKPIGRLLDIGCGDGAFSVLLRDAWEAKEVYGVDMSSEAVETAKTRGINAVYVDLNMGGLPFDDGLFDVAFAGEVIEHLLSPDDLLDEIHRILKPEGCCVITTPNLGAWYNRLQLFMGWQPYAISVSPLHRGAGAFLGKFRGRMQERGCFSPSGEEGFGHIKFFTLRALKEILMLHGFKVVDVQGASFDEAVLIMPYLVLKVIRLVDMAISSLSPSLASRVVVVVRK